MTTETVEKIDLAKLKNLSQKDLTAKIRSGELKVPKAGRDEFFKFAAASAEDRAKMLGEQQPAPKAEEPPKEPPKPEPQPAAPEAPVAVPKWKELGYESEAEAIEALGSLRAVVDDQKSTIDRFNAERGVLGRKVKELEEKVVSMSKPKPADKPAAEPSSKKPRPKMPLAPDAGEFDGGQFDKAYVEARKKYLSDMEKYSDELAEWVASQQKPVPAIEELKQKVEGVAEFVEGTKRQQRDDTLKSEWSKLWDAEIPKLQAAYGFNTSVSVKSMSDDWGIVENQQAPAELRKQAKARLDLLPKADHEAYQRVNQLASARFDFSQGVPVQKYRTWEGAAADNGIALGPVGRQAPPPPREQPGIKAPTGADMSRGDPRVEDISDGDAAGEFKKLLGEYQGAVKAGNGDRWKNSPAGQRFADLRRRFSVA